MKRAIHARLLAMALIAVAVCGAVSSYLEAVDAQNRTMEWLGRLTLAASAIRAQTADAKAMASALGGVRVTLISPSGVVLSDSEADASAMEPHNDRLEFINAKEGEAHFEIRKSSSLSKGFMYSSIKLPNGEVLRLAHEYPGLLSSLLTQFPAFVAAIAASLALSLILARRFASDIAAPLEDVVNNLSNKEFDKLSSNKDWKEIDKLLQSLGEMLKNLDESNQSLLSEREKVNRILSEMPEGFILLDSKKSILLCNNSAKRFFGCERDVLYSNILLLIRDTSINGAIDSALLENRPSSLETKSHSGLTLRVSVSPVAAGELVEGETCATVMLVDITSERMLQQQKQDFFANASHELKTPITSIMGFSEMLGSGALKGEDQAGDVLGRIEKEAKRMSALIDDILQISNLESKSKPVERSVFDLSAVAREAAAPAVGAGKVSVNLDLSPVHVFANSRQMGDLCSNLIDNAAKYNVPGGSVDISLRADGDKAVLVVSDTGIGIPEDLQERVFERFFRASSRRGVKTPGTGLGLSIVKHIVNLYGGEIILESKEGKGTRVEVRLPVIADPGARSEKSQEK